MKLRLALAFALFSSCAVAQTNQGTSPLTGTKGGTNNSFMQFTGPASSIKTFTLPNATDTIATLAAAQALTNKTIDCTSNTCTVRAASDITGQLPIANGGSGQTTKQAAFDALGPTATRAGDLLYWNGTHYVTLAGNNSGTQFLQETSSGVPSWVTVSGTGTVTSIICGTGLSGGTITTAGTCAVNVAAKSDQQTGTSNILAITPLHQQDHDSAAKAWVSFAGGSGAINGTSYNVSGVTRTSAGLYTVSFSTAFASANYACNTTANGAATNIATTNTQLAGSIVVNNVISTTGVANDPNAVFVVCFGRQ